MMYRAQLADLDFASGEESLETVLYRQHQIPWQEMAFSVIEHTLRFFIQDLGRDKYDIYHGDLRRIQENPARYELTLF